MCMCVEVYVCVDLKEAQQREALKVRGHIRNVCVCVRACVRVCVRVKAAALEKRAG
jgi:hypothetical protein